MLKLLVLVNVLLVFLTWFLLAQGNLSELLFSVSVVKLLLHTNYLVKIFLARFSPFY